MSISLRRSPRRWLVLASLMLSGLVSAAEPVVRIGTGDWVPYVDQHRADGGALARLISAVFAAAGYQVEFSFYPWDRNVLMLQQGELDAIMPYSCSPMRLNYGVCSEPLVRGEIVLFHRKDQAFDWQRIEDLQPYRIATTLGYSYGPQFDQALQAGQLQVEQNSKEDTAFRLLALGRVDLHPQDRAVGGAVLGGATGAAIPLATARMARSSSVSGSPAQPQRMVRSLSSTCRLTRVRHPSAPGASSPGFPAGEIVVTGSAMPPKRTSASSSTRFFSTRCSARSMWPKSAPPGRSAGATLTSAAAHTCGRRCGEASSTSTMSARQNDAFDASVSSARTRSPGIAPSTKTTRPSWRATQWPPWATRPTVRQCSPR